MDKESRRNFVIYGTPFEMLDQTIDLQDIGINNLIVNFESKGEMGYLDLFADKVTVLL